MFWKNILFVLSFAFYKNQIVQKSAEKYDCSDRFRKQKKITDKGKFNGSYLLFDFTFAELYKFIKLLNYYIRFSPI